MIARRGLLIHPEEIGEYWLKRLENSGLNLLGIHPVGGPQAADTLVEAIAFMSKAENLLLLDRYKDLGLEIEYEIHAMSWLLPRDLYEKHPEMFRMDVNGTRTNDFNLCTSNKDALDCIEERAERLAGIFVPTTDRYYFWTDDVKDMCCCCKECRKLSPSDQAMTIYNTILRGIKKANPQAMHCYLAYNETMAPPGRVEPEDGIFLEFAPIRRDSAVPIDDDTCSLNGSEIASLAGLLDCFGRRNAQVLEYWIDNSRFSGWKKPPQKLVLNSDVMKRDVEFYHSMGFESITSFACYLGEDYYRLHGEPPLEEYSHILQNAG